MRRIRRVPLPLALDELRKLKKPALLKKPTPLERARPWDTAIIAPLTVCCDDGRLSPHVIARHHLRELGMSPLDIDLLADIPPGSPLDWETELGAIIAELEASSGDWALLVWPGRVDFREVERGTTGNFDNMMFFEAEVGGQQVYIEAEIPEKYRLFIVWGSCSSWSWLMYDPYDPFGSTLPKKVARQSNLDDAMNAARVQARFQKKKAAEGYPGALQIDADDVGLTGTPDPGQGQPAWASMPFALALKNTAGTSSYGDFVTYPDRSPSPGTVQGFTAAKEYWRWSNTSWPDAFKITPVGGDPDVDASVGSWIEVAEGELTQTPALPGGSGGKWYRVRESGETVTIGYLWVDSTSAPTEMWWYGREALLSDKRFDGQGALNFVVTTKPGASALVGFKRWLGAVV